MTVTDFFKMNKKQFKEKLNSGQSVFGPFMNTIDPAFVESIGHTGFDFVVLDLEHGPASLDQLQNLIRAADFSGTFPVVRTPPGNLHMIGAAQDAGARGILVPQIKNENEVKNVVKSARFHPKGERGVSGVVRAANYSMMKSEEYFTISNKNILIIQLEGKEAIDNIDSILDVPDVDIIFIGPYDLSQSLGVPGQVDHPKVTKTIQQAIQKIKAKGLIAGTFVSSVEGAKNWVDAGVQFVEASKNIIKQLQENI